MEKSLDRRQPSSSSSSSLSSQQEEEEARQILESSMLFRCNGSRWPRLLLVLLSCLAVPIWSYMPTRTTTTVFRHPLRALYKSNPFSHFTLSTSSMLPSKMSSFAQRQPGRLLMADNSETNDETPATPAAPKTFREAEIIGLKFMQEGDYDQALKAFEKGMTLPGSRPDVIRTPLLAKSPVGGGASGKESRSIQGLDEFEMQAAYYNMACAHAQLGNVGNAIASLRKAFDSGFDNYNTVRDDPDLDPIKDESDFEKLMDEYEPKGFNPFGFFGSGKK